MRTHAQIALHLQELIEPPKDDQTALEGFVAAYAHRARRRKVTDEEFERAVLGYARARAIAYNREFKMDAAQVHRLRRLFDSVRGDHHQHAA